MVGETLANDLARAHIAELNTALIAATSASIITAACLAAAVWLYILYRDLK